MKKREKTLRLSRETIQELGTVKLNPEVLNQVAGGCILPSSHFPHYCPEE